MADNSVDVFEVVKSDFGPYPDIQRDLDSRNALGFKTYGKVMRHTNDREWIVECYQELLDACAYAKAEYMRTGSARIKYIFINLQHLTVEMRAEIDARGLVP